MAHFVAGVTRYENFNEINFGKCEKDTIVVDRDYFLEHEQEIKEWALKRKHESESN